MRSIDDIEAVFLQRGHAQYSGEPVTQLQHALQSAAFWLLKEKFGPQRAIGTAVIVAGVMALRLG